MNTLENRETVSGISRWKQAVLVNDGQGNRNELEVVALRLPQPRPENLIYHCQ